MYSNIITNILIDSQYMISYILRKSLVSWVFVSLLIFNPSSVKADQKYLWLEFEKSRQGVDSNVESFILRFGESPFKAEDIRKLESVEAGYFNGEKDRNGKLIFYKLNAERKDKDGILFIIPSGFQWYLLVVRSSIFDNGVRYIYTARMNFTSEVNRKKFPVKQEGDWVDAEELSDFDFMVFYKRKAEDFFVNRINWSAIIVAINFNGQSFRNKRVLIFDADGDKREKITNNEGCFTFVPRKGEGDLVQSLVSAHDFIGGIHYVGTYTILLESRILPLRKNKCIGVGVLIFLSSSIITLGILIFLRRRYES